MDSVTKNKTKKSRRRKTCKYIMFNKQYVKVHNKSSFTKIATCLIMVVLVYTNSYF